MQTQLIAISQIRPSSRNARKHSAKQIRQIADSIVAFAGYLGIEPVVTS